LYEYTAKQWTENFAKEQTVDDKVKKLMEMGFPEEMCRDALQRYDNDENLALNYLLGG
jgi:ubiquitin-conjugating enzyme (huntingtin interacting protein 2)